MASAVALAMVLTMKDKASKTAGKAGKALGKLGTLAGGVALGAVAAGGAMAGMALKMANDSAKIDQTRKTFDKLAISIGSDGVEALGLLGDATRGMVADADLMLAGNKFMAMGLADSAEGAADLAEMATQLGLAMGEEAGPSMENFALMLANQSIPRLDSFGISSGKVRERILELMDATEGLTREQAFMQAVMEQGNATMAKVGEQGNTLAAKTAVAQAQFANFKDVLGQAFMPILNMVMDGLGTLATNYGPAIIAWVQEAAAWMGTNLPIALKGLSDIWAGTLQPALVTFSDWIQNQGIPAAMAIYNAIQDNLTPILAGLAAMLLVTVVPAFVAWAAGAVAAGAATIVALAPVVIPIVAIGAAVALLAKAWEEDWGGIQTKLTEVWEEHIKPILGGLAEGISKVKDAFGKIIGKIKDFKDSLKFSLPDWALALLPGSPPPLAAGLARVATAFGIADKAMGKFKVSARGISDGTKSLEEMARLTPSFAELFAGGFTGGQGTGSLSLGGGYSSGGTKGRDVGPGGEAPSWSDHVIMPPADTSGVLGIIQFVFDGKAMGEITLRTGAVAETSIDMTTLVTAKG